MRIKKIAASLISSVLAASMLAGCGVNKDAVVATLDGKEITLGVANFSARLQQAQYDDFYVAYFGEDVWSSDLYGNGSTMEDNTKDSVIGSLQELYTVKAHMDDYGVSLTEEEQTAIADAAAGFMSDNTDEAIEALGATEDIVKEYLTLLTVQTKMYDAIIVDADTEVSDEEANTSAYSYVRVSKTTYTDDNGNAVEYTDEQKAELAAKMDVMLHETEELPLETVAENNGYTVSTGTFAADNTTLDEAVLTALQGITEEGGIADVVETDSYYYILRLDKITDEEATEEHRQEIIEERQSDYYTEIVEGWKEASEWTLNEKVWKKVSFDNLFTTVAPETETVEETESVEGTESVQ